MSTTAAAPTGSDFKIIDRLNGVPAVHDSVAYAQAVINSTQTTSALYQTALGLATRSYNMASPIIERSKPLLNSADGLAVATFDRAQATFPYPFTTPTQDLVGVKQAIAVYDARVAPWLQQAQPVLTDVFNKTAEINSALGARASATIQSSQELSHAIVEQLRHIAEQGKELPGVLVENVGKITTDLKEIVLAKDQTLQDKSNKVGAYVVDHVKPIVDEIYSYVLGAKKKAEAELEHANGNGNSKAR